ncbi:MAG: xanthine dehydrogenase family protein subunit M [Oxalobacteraceae bacterium]|nr:MAG: xanthine dehydrogenase family protein subunit M [Oxalobacteraceae bacterium]
MNPFAFAQARNIDAALPLLAPDGARPVAGGTNLLDLMKEGVMTPSSLVDINPLEHAGLDVIEEHEGGLRLGALARNAATAYHDTVRSRYPLLSSAILAGASPQLRNMASNGGNLLQRTRCVYFYDVGTPCNKREPGTGCPAKNGINRQLAILGTSEQCIATHPSDMCVALRALDATVHVKSSNGGERAIPFAEFHRLPGDTPHIDTNLQPGELITHITLPDAARFVDHSAYVKVRDRLSYAFALVSVAAALDLDGGTIRAARIALGGVAHKPWRVEEAEQQLVGKTAGDAAFEAAADRILEGARGYGQNAFKLTLAKNAIVQALNTAVRGTEFAKRGTE